MNTLNERHNRRDADRPAVSHINMDSPSQTDAPLTIYVDGRALVASSPGIQAVTNQLIHGLRACGYSVEVLSWQHHGNPNRGAGAVWKLVEGLIWYGILLPWKLRTTNARFCLAPAHKHPLFLSAKITLISVVHDVLWKSSPQHMAHTTRILEHIFFPRLVRRSDAIICLSMTTASDLEKHFAVSKRKTWLIPPAYRQQNKRIDRGGFILFVGTIEPRKNVGLLLNAYQSLSKGIRSSYRLVVAGKAGSDYASLKGLLEYDEPDCAVSYLGEVSSADLEKLYRSCDAVVIPSHHEGFGLPALEAMSYGKPVIASNAGALPEVVGDAGIIFKSDSVKSLQTAIESFANDDTAYERLSVRSIKRASMFSSYRQETLLRDLMAALLKGLVSD